MSEQWKRFTDNLRDGIERGPYCVRRKKNIGYIGWIGHGNLGDEVMYQAICAKWADTNLIHYAYPRREERLARFGLSGFPFFSGVLLGGGTLISPGFIDLVRTALNQGVPIFTLGTGVGSSGYEQPIEVDLGEWKTLLPRFQRLGVRGPLSQQRLLKQNIEKSEIIGDIALSLSQPRLFPAADPPEFLVNVALPDGDAYGGGEYRNVAALEAVIKALTKEGWRPIPIAMAEKDIAPTQALINAASAFPATTERVTSAGRFFELARACSLTIAVRLHTAILSACVGVPPLMLGYRDKCMDFMESVELGEWYVDLNVASPADIQEKAFRLSKAAPELRPAVLEKAQYWRKVQEAYLDNIRGAIKMK